MPAMRLRCLPSLLLGLLAGLALAAGPTLGSEQQAVEASASPSTWALEAWSPPFDFRSPTTTITYRPLERASQKWRICASYPHLKDSYWLSVNYGMVEEAKRLGVALRVVEAGGYPNLERQIAQITECAQDADILALGAVSFDGLTEAVLAISEEDPGARRGQRHRRPRHQRQGRRLLGHDGGGNRCLPRQPPSGGHANRQGGVVPRPAGVAVGLLRRGRVHRGARGQRGRYRREEVGRHRPRNPADPGRGSAGGTPRCRLHRGQRGYRRRGGEPAQGARPHRADPGAGGLLHPRGLSRHQARQDPRRAHRLPRPAGPHGHRDGGAAARRQARTPARRAFDPHRRTGQSRLLQHAPFAGARRLLARHSWSSRRRRATGAGRGDPLPALPFGFSLA